MSKLARLVDVIEAMIKQMLDENHGVAVISRSSLAEKVNCVPSQITYVLSTRFTNGQGFIVESRRGGGGQIRISRVQNHASTDYLMHTINSLGQDLSQQQAEIYLQNFLDYQIIAVDQAKLMMAAVSDNALSGIDSDRKGTVRMDIFKNMLISLITGSI
jgi:transcriptional regulator CtsR